jgi:hypothetical protein
MPKGGNESSALLRVAETTAPKTKAALPAGAGGDLGMLTTNARRRRQGRSLSEAAARTPRFPHESSNRQPARRRPRRGLPTASAVTAATGFPNKSIGGFRLLEGLTLPSDEAPARLGAPVFWRRSRGSQPGAAMMKSRGRREKGFVQKSWKTTLDMSDVDSRFRLLSRFPGW